MEYFLITVFSKERRPAIFKLWSFDKQIVFKSIALPCSRKWDILLKRAPQYRDLENGGSFRLRISLTILGIFCEFEG